MTKKDAISIISKCATLYAANLSDRQLAFVLKEDIRNIIPKPPGKIFAIFRKPIRQDIYTELTFRSGNVDITKKCLPPDLLKKVNISLFLSTLIY